LAPATGLPSGSTTRPRTVTRSPSLIADGACSVFSGLGGAGRERSPDAETRSSSGAATVSALPNAARREADNMHPATVVARISPMVLRTPWARVATLADTTRDIDCPACSLATALMVTTENIGGRAASALADKNTTVIAPAGSPTPRRTRRLRRHSLARRNRPRKVPGLQPSSLATSSCGRPWRWQRISANR
jgi:hypothetical protein